MAIEIPSGHRGNLTPDQQEKLRLFWVSIFKICKVNYAGADAIHAQVQAAAAAPASPVDDKKKKRGGFFKRGNDAPAKSSGAEADNDKYGQGKIYQEALSSMGPELLLKTLWEMVKMDHPDALALRFLRARKWDVDKAIVMLISTLHWRAVDMKVDSDIMKNGEAAAVEAGKSSDPAIKKNADDFLYMMRTSETFLHGHDSQNRPICLIRVRQHKIGELTEASMERSTVYVIETCRMLLKSPAETSHIIFDLTGFSLANMDYVPVKFIIKCFEANYPECLGVVCVHRAPWIFQGIWKIIKGWLDPVVAAKVQFTNNAKDLEQFIPRANILKELDGPEDFEFKYVEPVPGENDLMKDTVTRDKLQAEQQALFDEFQSATTEWIVCPPESDQKSSILARRDEIATRMLEQFWKVDPYVRARGVYDRTGIIKPGGVIDFYPKPEANGNGTANGYTNGNGVANGYTNGAAH